MIQKQLQIPDGAGGRKIVWRDVSRTFAEITEMMVGYEKFVDLQIINQKFYSVTIRFMHGLEDEKKIRIIYGKKILDVHRIINENCEKNESLKMLALEKINI